MKRYFLTFLFSLLNLLIEVRKSKALDTETYISIHFANMQLGGWQAGFMYPGLKSISCI